MLPQASRAVHACKRLGWSLRGFRSLHGFRDPNLRRGGSMAA